MSEVSRVGLRAALEARGISRRQFVKFCSTMVATMALPPRYLHAVVKALDQTTRPVLVWLEFQDCAGNSESMLRSGHPSVGDFVLELLSWEYHELIMAGSGKHAEEALERVVRDHKGEYIAVVEGRNSHGGRRRPLHHRRQDRIRHRKPGSAPMRPLI
jgi:hydrogenase small subunit